MEFCTCLTPLISLTSSLKLTCLQFSHYLTCIRWTQCPSYCAWQSVPVLWREHQMWHILQMSLSSLVTWCSWWLHGMLSTLFCCAVTPNVPPSALTTAFACSRAWPIIIGEKFRLDLCTITFQFRTPEVVSVKSYCLCRGQEYIVHNLQSIVFGKIEWHQLGHC